MKILPHRDKIFADKGGERRKEGEKSLNRRAMEDKRGKKKGRRGERKRKGRRKIIGMKGSGLSLHKTSICSWPNLYLLPRRGGGSLIPIDQGGRRGEEKRH